MLVRIGHEAVTDAAHGLEVPGRGGIFLDVAAQPHDEVVDGAGVSVLADMPRTYSRSSLRETMR